MAASPPEKVKNLLTSFLVTSNQTKGTSDCPDTPVSKGASEKNGSTEAENSAGTTPVTTSSGALRSYDRFLQRLESFSSITWFGKPLELSPLECSRNGWENVDTDMLLCVSCKAFLSGRLPNKMDASAYEESVSKLRESLRTAHDKFCVLAANPCPKHFCTVSCHDPVSLLSGFVERATALNKVQDRLPTIAFQQLNDLGYDEGQAGAYCKRHLMQDQDVSIEAVALAFMGWTIRNSSQDVLECTKCRRKVGLWNFWPKSPGARLPDSTTQDKDTDDTSDEPSPKRRRMTDLQKQTFSPLEEHRHWCPWLKETPRPQASGTAPSTPSKDLHKDKYPACILALTLIAPGLMGSNTGLAHTMKTSPMVEGLRCFRRVINTWSSPKVHMEKSPT